MWYALFGFDAIDFMCRQCRDELDNDIVQCNWCKTVMSEHCSDNDGWAFHDCREYQTQLNARVHYLPESEAAVDGTSR